MKSFIDLINTFRFEINEDNLLVRTEQINARIGIYPMMWVAQLLVAPLMVGMVWDLVSHAVLLLWLAAVVGVHATEVYYWYRHRRSSQTLEQNRAWDRWSSRMTAVTAMVWGSAAVWMFVPGDLAYQSLLICVWLCMVAGSTISNPFHPPALFIYATGMILPLAVRLAWENDPTHWILAIMVMTYYVYALVASAKLIRTFEWSQQQRLENARLVSELQAHQREVEAARRTAEQANQSKSRFLAMASHDLRQPLQALRLFSDALEDRATEGEIAHLAGRIGKSVEALADMFDDLLDVSRLDAGIIEPRWQHFRLAPLFDRLYAELAPQAQARGLSLEVPVCSGGKCTGECSAVVHSDPFLIERVLRNLLSNAIRYTDKGGVMLRCLCHQDAVELQVVDTGIGIRAEALPHIFEEYYQVDNPHRDRRKGLGLGLAIVRRIEQLLHFHVEVRSEPGVGSVFSFSLPRGDVAKLAQPFLITQSRYDLKDRVVALVEDDEDIRAALQDLMKQWGCNVVAEESADEVIRRLDRDGKRPDVLVCDYRLPYGVTAIEVMRRMRELWGSDLPVVVLTGDTAPGILQTVYAERAVLLHKPIAPMRLRAMMYHSIYGES